MVTKKRNIRNAMYFLWRTRAAESFNLQKMSLTLEARYEKFLLALETSVLGPDTQDTHREAPNRPPHWREGHCCCIFLQSPDSSCCKIYRSQNIKVQAWLVLFLLSGRVFIHQLLLCELVQENFKQLNLPVSLVEDDTHQLQEPGPSASHHGYNLVIKVMSDTTCWPWWPGGRGWC